MSEPLPFEQFIASLQSLTQPGRLDPAMQAQVAGIAAHLDGMGAITRESLERFVAEHPDSVPVLATCVGLTQEQLKNHLSHRLGSAGWVTLARTRPAELISFLDELGLARQLDEQLRREWSFADVLLERYLWSRRTAASAVGQGRRVEDVVEGVVRRLGLPYQARTRFGGRGEGTAPCDLALPRGGTDARIVIAMKGFNSTGSKLTDAVREIESMASVRAPRQYVFAVVDGIGWRNRRADLRRIHRLWDSREIDGLYTLAHLDQFEADLLEAAGRVGVEAREP